MGLGWGESVPVDTHVWQIAQRDYKFGKKAKTFNKAMYDAVGDHFRDLWGEYAGWAHSVLFTADLRQFADRATTKTEPVDIVKVKVEASENEDVITGLKRKSRASIIKMEDESKIKLEVQRVVKLEQDMGLPMPEDQGSAKRRKLRPRR